MYCSREYSNTSRLIQQYEKSTSKLLLVLQFLALKKINKYEFAVLGPETYKYVLFAVFGPEIYKYVLMRGYWS